MPEKLHEKSLIDKDFQLQKFPGKGGWTYVPLPEIPNQKAPFGLKKVKGSIDGYKIHQYHLLAMGNGHLFLPVKAAIRKNIRKESGDYVHIILYEDSSILELSQDFVLCLKDEPQAFANFTHLDEKEQKKYIDWIYAAKSHLQLIDRMAEAINDILAGRRR